MTQPIPYTEVRIESPFWDPIIAVTRKESLGVIYEKLKGYGTWDAMRLTWKPGDPVKPDMILWDSDMGKYIEAASYALYHERDEELEARVEEAIDMIVNMQQADGYIGFYHTAVEPGRRWSSLAHNLELYSAGHLLEAAIARHVATGCPANDRFLGAMLRYVRLIQQVFGNGEDQLRDYPGHQEIELALMRLYGLTGDRSLVDLTQYFIEERGRTHPPRQGHAWDIATIKRGDNPDTFFPYYWPGPRCYWHMQAHLPLREQREIVGHSVQAMYWLAAVTDLAVATGERSYIDVTNRLWKNMVEKKMYVTGGIGSVHLYEGFGPEYDLPNETSYAETCAAIGVMFLAQRKLKVHSDGAVADIMERSLYNAVLAGLSFDGKTFNYDNPLATVGCSHQREGWFKVFCCPSNICRLLNTLGGYLYGCDRVGESVRLTVHMYVSGEVRVGQALWHVDTEWPWHGRTRFTVTGSEPALTVLRLRVPCWAGSHQIRINGDPVRSEFDHGYISLPSRKYSPSDTVELDLPMTATRITSHPLVHQNRDCIALQRGPFIYTLESIDQESRATDLRLVHIDRRASLETCEMNIQGRTIIGVTTQGTVVDVPGGSQLYMDDQSRAHPEGHPVTLRFIPYFAWGNRGPSDMRVWIPQCP
ncbi:hypothetical protein CDV55_102293 [Aspergillus turcosus]|nr:hypothetical protein CDV55_102293 [Aspergillus turcosus]